MLIKKGCGGKGWEGVSGLDRVVREGLSEKMAFELKN